MLRAIKESRFAKILSSFTKNRLDQMSAQVESTVEPEAALRLNKRAIEEDSTEETSSVKLAKMNTTGGEQYDEITRMKKRNYAMMLSYLGRDYYGMQRNPGISTIEEDLIGALFKAKLISSEAFETIQTIHFQRAARTDKGVSASRQIVSLRMPEHANIEDINKYLPDVIRVFGLKRVTKGFNSKIQCNARTYSYTLPTFAFAPDDPNGLRQRDTLADQVDLEAREKYLLTIDGKPYNEFRLNPELRERINTVLKLFEGSHNYHNFTSRVKPLDPRAKRFIISFVCSEPYVSQGVEFVTLQVKGQSFMLHQIRKMVAVAIGIVRNIAPDEFINEAFKPERLDIPIVPSLGLVLHHVHYDNYNKRYGSDGLHATLDWEEVEDKVKAFHKEYILRHIEDTEIKERSMFMWLVSLAMHTYGARDQHSTPSEDA